MNCKVNHIGIYTNHLEELKEFYIKYFHATSNDKYVNPRGFSSYFLSFNSDTRIEIMHNENLEERESIELMTGIVHIAFSVGSKENVDSLTEILKNDGYSVTNGPRWTGDGYYESKILDPDGNCVEITI